MSEHRFKTGDQASLDVKELQAPYPFVRASFINALSEEGTREELVRYLQEQWNETCAVRSALREANSWFARAEQEYADFKKQKEARVAELEKVLKWIDEQRYVDRSTVSQDNAWEAWQKLNRRVVAIYDRARAALSTGAGEEKR